MIIIIMTTTGMKDAGTGGMMNMKGFTENIATGEKMNISVTVGNTANSGETGMITTAIIILPCSSILRSEEEWWFIKA